MAGPVASTLAQLRPSTRTTGAEIRARNQKTLADLKTADQVSRRNEQAIEADDLEIQKIKTAIEASAVNAQRKVKADAIIQGGGGVQDLVRAGFISEAMEWQKQEAATKAASLQEKQGMRTEAMETAKLMEGQPGVSPQVPMAPTQQSPVGSSLEDPTQMGPMPAPQTPPGMRTIDAVAAPHAPVNIPGVYGPDMSVVPQTRQQIDMRAQEAADATAQRTRETQRAQQQAEAEFAVPAKPSSPTGIVAEYEYAKAQGYKGTFEQYQDEDANRKSAVVGDAAQEPLVAVMGPDNQPVLVKRSEAEGKRPASTREQGRPVTSGDANRIADYDTSLDDLAELRSVVSGNNATGTSAKIGAMMPDAVTDLFGWGEEAKQKQATIDRVKQVIGKALEGGVLRKEDEYKYEKILPKLADTAAVVKTKLDGLEKAIAQRRVTTIDALEDAGYDVGAFRERTRSGATAQRSAPPAGSGEPSEALIQSNMRANPTMTRQQVIEELKK